MGVHVEWMSAAAVHPETVRCGVAVGEHAVTEPLGLVLGGLGDCALTVIEGDREALVKLLDRARASLDHPDQDDY